MKKKVIYFTKYSALGASSRLRSFQFFPFLEREGYEVKSSPLFGDKYLLALYSGKKIKLYFLFTGYIKRFLALFKLKKDTIVIIEKELFPYLPSWFEVLLKRLGFKYVADYDDAIFHNYDLSGNPVIKKFLSKKIDHVMKNSACVFAGNSYLAARAKNAGAQKTIILPTVIDIEKYRNFNNKNKAHFTVGWIGSPSTYKYLKELVPVFYKLKEEFTNFYVNIIGAKQTEQSVDFLQFIPWMEENEVEEINKFDLGIMPLHSTPWELGKCSYKLIQYMGCSIPILASPVGMNGEVVDPGENGNLVKDGDWYLCIKKYIEKEEDASAQGMRGRTMVEQRYSVESNLPKILAVFSELAPSYKT